MKSKQYKKKLSLNVMHGHDKGLVLIVALALMAILAIVSTIAVFTTTTDIRISGNFKTSVQAFYVAEAGIHDGISRLRNGAAISDSGAKTNPNWNTTTTYSSTGFNNSFTVTHEVSGGSVVTDESGTPLFLITSTGTSSTSIKQIEAVVRIVYALPFTKALEGCDGVTISSNGFTDSYDSALGSYASQVIPASSRKDSQNNEWARDKGHIGTSNAGADIIVDGNAQVHGNAKATRYVGISGTGNPTTRLGTPANLTGYKGSPDTNSSNAVIYGVPTENNSSTSCDPLNTTTIFNEADDIITSNNNSEIVNLPSPPNNPYNSSTKDFSLGSNDTFSLGSSGQIKNYHFSSFELKSNSGLTINGDVTFYVSGKFEVDSNTNLTLSSGSKLTVYVTGELEISSNAIVNPGVPTDLMIYSSAASSANDEYKVDIRSNSTITGTIYAPNAAINISSNSNSLGAIKGKYINASSNAKFHYDEALGRLEGYPVIGYKIISWREVN